MVQNQKMGEGKLTKYIEFILNSNINALVCHSKAGFGKTYTTLSSLKQIFKDGYNDKVVYNSGVTTALSLYMLLHDNKDKVIVLDDIENILSCDRALNLLKATLWGFNGLREITYKTTSKLMESYPDSFIFTGKVIILANNIYKYNKNCESFNAVLSRCTVFELKYTLTELKEKAKEILNKKFEMNIINKQQFDECIKLINIINYKFNLRCLEHIVEFVKFDIKNAKELYISSLNEEKDEFDIVYEILQKHFNVEMQVAEYREMTGKSRASFFRIKKKIKD